MSIIKYSKFFVILSLLILLPGVVSLTVFGLKLSVDFSGGSVFTYSADKDVNSQEISNTLRDAKFQFHSVSVSDNQVVIKTAPLEPKDAERLKNLVELNYAGTKQTSFETVGPTVGKETTKNAFLAVLIASLAIVLYIAYSFKNIPKPYSSYRFGISAIIAMLHDALVILGLFSVLGHFYGTEVTALFITAVLTVIGFSVHDTIVVFDRIRENLKKLPKSYSFAQVADFSLIETLGRSMATSLTVVITLFSLFVLGGASTRDFVLALLVGIISGTYSSIFTATPILVMWENYSAKSRKK